MKNKGFGRRVRCTKCGKPFYDLGKKVFICPSCRVDDLIPDSAVAKVRIKIRRGGHEDQKNGWTNGIATKSERGAVYLNCRFEVIDGKYRGKSFFSLVGLYSPKGDWWGSEGRKTLRAILNSAGGFFDDDYSPAAVQSRKVEGLEAFDEIEFVAEIERKKGRDGIVRNQLKAPISPEDERYNACIGISNAFSNVASREQDGIVDAIKPKEDVRITPIPSEDNDPIWLKR